MVWNKMSEESTKKRYAHLCKLIDDVSYRESFSKTVSAEGESINPVRAELIKSDAIRNKAKLEKKFPFLTGKEEEPNILTKIAVNKSKVKKDGGK